VQNDRNVGHYLLFLQAYSPLEEIWKQEARGKYARIQRIRQVLLASFYSPEISDTEKCIGTSGHGNRRIMVIVYYLLYKID
jgi:hypothetical protein